MPEKQSCQVLHGAWYCPRHAQNFVQKHPSPNKAYYRGEAWYSVDGWRFHPAPQINCSRHGGWRPIQWLKGHIYCPWAACMHLSFALARGAHEHDHHWRHSAFNAPPSVRSPPHTVVSPVIQSQPCTPGVTTRLIASNQKPVYKALNWQPRRSVVRLLRPLRLRWYGRPVSPLCRKIVQTHPSDTPGVLAPFAENSLQSTILQYVQVFDLANYATRCIQRTIQQETHAILNRQSARQTSPKVAATWLTSVPVSPDAVLFGLTGIHHSVGWVMGCTYLPHFTISTLEPINTDQMHCNAI